MVTAREAAAVSMCITWCNAKRRTWLLVKTTPKPAPRSKNVLKKQTEVTEFHPALSKGSGAATACSYSYRVAFNSNTVFHYWGNKCGRKQRTDTEKQNRGRK